MRSPKNSQGMSVTETICSTLMMSFVFIRLLQNIPHFSTQELGTYWGSRITSLTGNPHFMYGARLNSIFSGI